MHYTCVGMTATETQTRAQKVNLQNSMKSEQEFKSDWKQINVACLCTFKGDFML